MNCCEECFRDIELKSIISANGEKGRCDYCNSEDVFIIDINKRSYLHELLEALIDIYSPTKFISGDYPKENSDLLKNILYNKWNIFRLDPSQIYRLLKDLLPEKYENNPLVFDESVGISELINPQIMNRDSLLGNYNWVDFVCEIKTKNRFHTNIINNQVFDNILERIKKTCPAGSTFFRARLCKDKVPYNLEVMGAPPAIMARGGRVNPEGISCLYLGDSEDTTIYEVRAGRYDYVSVAKFELKENVEIIDLTSINKISPFSDTDYILNMAINLPHLQAINDELSKPLNSRENILNYLPTQYICDYIKSKGYGGIQYKSVMNSDGINYAFFEPEKLKGINVKTFFIENLSVHKMCQSE